MLANRQRLRMMCRLDARPNQAVSDMAGAMRLPVPVASEYLRALNARGLLQARREGRYVLYRLAPDPLVPQADAMLNALRRSLHRPDFERRTFSTLTAFTHERRIRIVRVLAGKSMGLYELRRSTGISLPSLLRHLRKLTARGFVARTGQGYAVAAPRSLLAKTLLDLALRP